MSKRNTDKNNFTITDESAVFKIDLDPVDSGHSIYSKKTHIFEPGLTVLTGCNGSGKTTLLQSIHNILSRDKSRSVPHIFYSTLDTGTRALRNSVRLTGAFSLDAIIMKKTSSEGEYSTNSLALGFSPKNIDDFLENGMDIYESCSLFSKDVENKAELSKYRFILIDGIDSGLSIDVIDQYKQYMFRYMKEKAEALGLILYIIVSANNYATCEGSRCYDVQRNRYITFSSYEDFRKFISKSFDRKIRSIEKAEKEQKALADLEN